MADTSLTIDESELAIFNTAKLHYQANVAHKKVDHGQFLVYLVNLYAKKEKKK